MQQMLTVVHGHPKLRKTEACMREIKCPFISIRGEFGFYNVLFPIPCEAALFDKMLSAV